VRKFTIVRADLICMSLGRLIPLLGLITVMKISGVVSVGGPTRDDPKDTVQDRTMKKCRAYGPGDHEAVTSSCLVTDMSLDTR